jgi:TPR repeat protein
MYWRGDGIALNNAEAFRLFQKAAAKGHTGARIKPRMQVCRGTWNAEGSRSSPRVDTFSLSCGEVREGGI